MFTASPKKEILPKATRSSDEKNELANDFKLFTSSPKKQIILEATMSDGENIWFVNDFKGSNDELEASILEIQKFCNNNRVSCSTDRNDYSTLTINCRNFKFSGGIGVNEMLEVMKESQRFRCVIS
jgi:hypothetical protein